MAEPLFHSSREPASFEVWDAPGRLAQLPLLFVVWWAIANGIGGGLVNYLEANGFEFMATLVLTGPIVGVCQWLVLRRYLQRVRWWAVVSAIAWVLAVQVSILGSGFLTPIIDGLYRQFGLWEVFWVNLVNGFVWLGIFGTVQWFLLARQGWNPLPWLAATFLGGMVWGGTGAALCNAICGAIAGGFGSTLVGVAAWGVYGIITGLVLRSYWANRP